MPERENRHDIAEKLRDVIADLDEIGFDISAAHAQLALDTMIEADLDGKVMKKH